MDRTNRFSRSIVFCVLASFAASPFASGVEGDSASLRAIHDRLGDSVVRVEVVVRKQLDNGVDVDLESQGIGLVTKPGLVMTPSSLFKDSATLGSRVAALRVTTKGGARFDGELFGIDTVTSLAFVAVADAKFPGKPAEFATDDSLGVGDFFATIRISGPSFRHVPYVDAFLVSAALDDPKCYITTYAIADYLGAPVVAFDGRIVGIVNQMSLLGRGPRTNAVNGQSDLDLFADLQGYDSDGQEIVVVPASRFRAVVDDPPKMKHDAGAIANRARPWLGIETQVLLPDLAAALAIPHDIHGVLVTRVLPGSPAAAAGLAAGDLLHSIDGEPLACAAEGDETEVSARFGAHAPGDSVNLSIRRGESESVAALTIAAAPPTANEARKTECDAFGLASRDLVYADRADLDLPQDATGARATLVKRTGFAGLAGLRVGDIVREVDSVPVKDSSDLAAQLTAKADATVAVIRLFVTRGADTLFVEMRPDWRGGK